MKKASRNLSFREGRWVVNLAHAIPGEYIEKDGHRVAKLKYIRRTFITKAEAENCLAILRNQKTMRRLGVEVPAAAKQGPGATLEKFAQKVLARQTWRKNTMKGARCALKALLASPVFNGKRLAEISAENVASYHAERGQGGKAAANADLAFLKMVFHRAVEWGELQRNPAATVKPFRLGKNRLRVLTDDEADLLFAAADPGLVPLLRLLITTGMRPHEAFNLRWEFNGWEVEKDLAQAILVLDKRLIFIPGRLAKNRKDGEVPLSTELVEMFRGLARTSTSEKVFPWKSDTPKGFARAVQAAKLKNVRLYTLKHTCASRMIRAGVDIVTVSELLRHSDIRMTMRYIHSDATSRREAVETISKIYFKATPAVDSHLEAGNRGASPSSSPARVS
jgi:integrase